MHDIAFRAFPYSDLGNRQQRELSRTTWTHTTMLQSNGNEARGLCRQPWFRFLKSSCLLIRSECHCIHELWIVSAVPAVLYRLELSVMTKKIPWIIAYSKAITQGGGDSGYFADGNDNYIIVVLHSATYTLTFKIASLCARPEQCNTSLGASCLDFFRLGSPGVKIQWL